MFLFKEIEQILQLTHSHSQEAYIFNRSSEEAPMNEFKTIEQIIDDLSFKNDYPLTFTNIEKEQAKVFFTVNNYYSFQIYRKYLPRVQYKTYSFSDCLTLYHFNSFLREEINKFTGVVELLFRATLIEHLCTYYSGEFHKGEFYLDKSIYAKENLSHEILTNFSKRIKESKSDAVIHHLKNKNNAIPFWLIVEEATFGELYYFVTSLKEDYRHYWIDQSFGKQYRKFIMGWIKSANIMRNTCAHYARLYARYFSAAPPKLLKEDIKQAGIKADQNKSLFAHLLTLKRIIQYNPYYHYDWNLFIDSLDQYITKNQDIISLIRMSFPVKWKEYLEIIEQ